jgi:predicted DNA-binding protein with PD1-like motif
MRGGDKLMLGVDNLRVESPYSIKIIQDVKYEHKMNDHATVHIKGIVEETTKMNGTINADYGDEVHLYYLDGENKKTIFKGLVAEVQTRKVNEVYYIDIEGIAATFQLDMKKKSRSFQDKDMEYPDLLNAIKGGRQSGCSIINTVGDGVKLDKPILQYRETDWELIKRVASTLNSVVFYDVLENRPRIVFGLPDWESHTITEAMPYSIHKDLAGYRIAGGSEAGLSPSDFIYYEIESGERYSIGAEVWFRKRQLYVSEIKGYMDRGLFVFKYRLSRRKGIQSNEIYNTDIVGLSLEGKVLDTQGEKVKLHLAIDDEQDKEKAYWFHYAPATGNMMYCMPQVGTSVHLHFIDKKAENAIVTGCIRENGSSCEKTSDPSIRYWGNEHGSELKMTPSGVSITGASKEPLSISIEDGVGITLTSHKKLTLNAKGDILFTTPKKIKLTATSQILIKKTGVDSGFSMENEFHFLGKNVIYYIPSV